MVVRVALVVGHQRRGGIARYTDELAAELVNQHGIAIVPVGSEKRVTELSASSSWSGWDGDWIENPADSQAGEATWIRHRLRHQLRRHRIDLVHGTKHLVPAGSPVPSVLTVHDLTPLQRSGDFPLAKRVLLPPFYRRSLRDAARLLAVSNATGDYIAAALPHMASKVDVVPLATSSLAGRAPQPVEALQGRSFALCVGDLSPRKNLPFLTGIWPAIYEKTGMELVAVGPSGRRSDEARRAIDSLEAQELGRWLGPVVDEELAWLYRHARVVCVPSLAEGFGLPVLEALACGRPVVTSDDPALVETGAGRSRHVSLRDPPAWIEAVCSAAGEKHQTLAVSRTWHDVAMDTVASYRRARLGSTHSA